MAKIGMGYGSECHLLRWMGRHRNSFNKAIMNAMGKSTSDARIDWLDFNFNYVKDKWYDSELKGLEFIDSESVVSGWKEVWPTSGEQHNWDAVGWLVSSDFKSKGHEERDIILVEAKAHTQELLSKCKATSVVSISKISRAFKRTAESLNIEYNESHWLYSYYQLANRLVLFDYLKRNNYNPHIVLVYFIGDVRDSKYNCPKDVLGWESSLYIQDRALGIEKLYNSENIHKVFIHVADDSLY